MNNVAKEMSADLNLIISDLSRLMDEMAAGNFKIKTDIEDKYVGKFVNLKDAIRNMNRKMDATLKSVASIFLFILRIERWMLHLRV